MIGTLSFWTYVLSGASLNIDSTFSLKNLSLELVSGTGSFSGSVIAGGVPSTSIPLVVGEAVTLSTASATVIDGLTIDATGGVIKIVAF